MRGVLIPFCADAERDLHRPATHVVMGQRDGGQRGILFRGDELLVVEIHGSGMPCSWKRRSMHLRSEERRLKRVALSVPALRLIALA